MSINYRGWYGQGCFSCKGFNTLLTTLLLGWAAMASAGNVAGTVTTAAGEPVRDAVIALYGQASISTPESRPGSTPTPAPVGTAIMDQRNRQFAPHVLVVQRNTSVRFPNSDDIRHQVYSFSAAKRFNLPLYHGVATDPLIFDKPGEVALGCNIHDRMLGYIYVVDTAWFAKTDEQGKLTVNAVPAGSYQARLWYPGLSESAAVEQRVQVPEQGMVAVTFANAVRELPPEPEPASGSWSQRRGAPL